MYTKEEIVRLNDIIQNLNLIDDKEKIKVYLEENVEDIDLFLSTLKNINKNKLIINKTKKEEKPLEYKKYTSSEVEKIFKENPLNEIINKYKKKDLVDMYISLYNGKPLSSYDKERIANSIYHHFYTINRTKVLLGKK